jgi:hypothetical protein
MRRKGVDDFIAADLPDGTKLAASKAAEGAINNTLDLAQRLSDASTFRNGQWFIPVKTLRKFRQNWDNIAARTKRYTTGDISDTSAAQAQGLAADAARDAINKAFPEVAALNKDFNFWRTTERVAYEASLRKLGQNHIVRHHVGAFMGHHLGTAVGAPPGVGMGLGVVAAEAVRSPGVRLSGAQALRGASTGTRIAGQPLGFLPGASQATRQPTREELRRRSLLGREQERGNFLGR